MSYYSNIYYNPETSGLELLIQLDEEGLSYEYNTFIVLRHIKSGRVFYASDRGCSCPTPFEDEYFREPDDTSLSEIQGHELARFTAEIEGFSKDWEGKWRNGCSVAEQDEVVQKVKKALRERK